MHRSTDLLLQLPMLLLLLLLLGSCCINHSHAQVDPGFCKETASSASLPAINRTQFWTSASSLEKETRSADISIFVDKSLNKLSVEWESASQKLRIVQDFSNGQILIADLRNPGIDSCLVTNVTEDSFSVVTSVNAFGTQLLIPSRRFFNAGSLRLRRDGDAVISGVWAETYYSCYYWNSMLATVEAKWWFVRGVANEAPLAVQIRGRRKEGEDFEIRFAVNSLRSLESKMLIQSHPFAAPTNVYCHGLVSSKQAVKTFNRFTLGVERLFPSMPDSPAYYFSESYDQQLNVTALIGDYYANEEAHKIYGNGSLASVHDFSRGIAYIINRRYGNCTFARIPTQEWDVTATVNGLRLKRPEEFFVPSISALQFKAQGTYRSYTVDSFAGYLTPGAAMPNGSRIPATVEYYMAYRTSFNPLGEPITKSVPLFLGFKSAASQYDSVTTVFNFDTSVQSTENHDVSVCFREFEKYHFEMLLSLNDLEGSTAEYISNYHNVFLYSLTNSISAAINVSPLRIIRPVVTLDAVKTLIVELTLTEKATVAGYEQDRPEAKLEDAAKNLTELADKRLLSVELAEDDVLASVPIVSVIRLDYRGDTTIIGGVSPGAVAGISIATLLAGCLLTIGLLLVIARVRNVQLLGNDGFGMQQFGTGRQSSI